MGVDQRQKEEKWASDTWHRKISRPVTVWMIIFILAGAARAIIPVLLQSWVESSEDSVSHSLMAAACGRY